MRPVRLIMIIAVTAAVQVGVLPAWRPFGIVPDLLAAVIVSLSVYATASQTLLSAMSVGLLLDLSSATDFGLRLGFYTVAALGTSLLSRFGLVFDSLAWRIGLATVIVAAANLTIILTLIVGGATVPIGVALAKIGVSVAVEILVVLAISPVVRWLGMSGEGQLIRGGA